MAVTEILGTDSLSSSRTTLNDNFNALQDEIVDIKALLDPTTNALTGVDANLLSLVVSGATALAALSSTSFNNTGESNLGGSVIKSGSYQDISTPSATLPATLADYNYFVDCTVALTLVAGSEGQEITLIAGVAGDVDATSVAAATNITLNSVGSTLSLRYLGSSWYVVGSHDVTIS
jgi:hypothetical protein